MGSAGHAFIAHTKSLSPAAGPDAGGWGQPPHPRVVVAGQRFWSRRGKRKQCLTIRRVAGETAYGRRDDEKDVTVKVARLLERRPDGEGAHYRFGGHLPRRYQTFATVCGLKGSEAILCLPDWHPARPVRLPAALLAPEMRQAGTWLSLSANLAAASGAQLEVANFEAAEDPGPGRLERPAVVFEELEAATTPTTGRRCGDIVVWPERPQLAALTGGNAPYRLFLNANRPPHSYNEGPVPDLESGGRVFFAYDGHTGHVCELLEVASSPNGLVLTLACPARPIAEPIPAPYAACAWRWRWFDAPPMSTHHDESEIAA